MTKRTGSKFEVSIDPSFSFSFKVNPALFWPQSSQK